MTDPCDLGKKLLRMGPKYLIGFSNVVWNKMEILGLRYRLRRSGLVFSTLGSEPRFSPLTCDSYLDRTGSRYLDCPQAQDLGQTPHYIPHMGCHTLGSIVAGQLSRTTILLTQFVQYDWVLVIGLALLLGLIAVIFLASLRVLDIVPLAKPEQAPSTL